MPRKPDLRLRRHQEAGTGGPQSCRSRAPAQLAWSCPLASASALGQQGPPFLGDQRAIVHQVRCGFLTVALILTNSCFILNPCPFQLVKPFIWPFAVGQRHRLVISHLPLAPSWQEQGVYTAESRNQKSRSGQLSSEWQLLGPWVRALPLCSALPQLTSSSGLGSRSLWGHSEDNNVLKQVYLGSARSLLFLGGSLPSGSAPHWEAPEMPLPSVSLIILPLPPSPATASGTSSSNTARIVRAPRPSRPAVPASVPSLLLFFRMECLSLAPPALSAWQTPSHLTNPPQGPLPPGSPPSSSHAPPPPGYLCSCQCFSCGTYHTVFYLFTRLSPPPRL